MVRSQFRRAEKLSSLNEDLAKAGKVPGTVLIDYAVGPLDDEIADVVDAEDVGGTPTSSRSAGSGWPTTSRWPS